MWRAEEQGLVMRAPERILLLSNNPVGDYVARIQSGVGRVCSQSSVRLESENTFHSGNDISDVLSGNAFDGIILTPPFSDDRHALGMIEGHKIPYVRIAPLLDPDRGSSVMMDEYDAARAVTALMLDKGHRRVAIMRGPSSHLVSMRRYNGYANALGGKGLRVDQSLVAQGDFSRESGRAQAGKLFAARPTAIFASNDEMAAGIIDAANAANIAIPETISIVGYDDNAVAKTVRPRLTSVRQPLEEMGEAACKLLLESILHPGRSFETVVVPYEIMERDSVAECGAG